MNFEGSERSQISSSKLEAEKVVPETRGGVDRESTGSLQGSRRDPSGSQQGVDRESTGSPQGVCDVLQRQCNFRAVEVLYFKPHVLGNRALHSGLLISMVVVALQTCPGRDDPPGTTGNVKDVCRGLQQ